MSDDAWTAVQARDSVSARVLRVGLDRPLGLFPARDGGLYYAERGTGWISRLEGDGRAVALVRARDPHDLAVDPQGDLHVANFQPGEICRLEADGQLRVVLSGLVGAVHLRFGGLETLYVCQMSGSIRRFTHFSDEAVLVSGFSSCHALAVGPHETLFFSDSKAGEVLAAEPGKAIRRLAGGFMTPVGLALAGDGSLYVGEWRGGRISRVTPGGAVETVATGLHHPGYPVLDDAGDLYVADAGPGWPDAPTGAILHFARLAHQRPP